MEKVGIVEWKGAIFQRRPSDYPSELLGKPLDPLQDIICNV